MQIFDNIKKFMMKSCVGLGLLMVVSLSAHAEWRWTRSSAQTWAYGTDPLQQLDVYLPTARSSQQRPILVLVHGGGWRMGDKSHRAVVKQKVAYWRDQRGFVVVSINYRLLPTPVDAQLRDVAQALRYVQQHAVNWGADAQQLILMGHSAGAHLVSLLSTQPVWLPVVDQPQQWRMSIVLDSAGYDLVKLMSQPHLRLYDQAFGREREYWVKLSPIHQIHQRVAPLLLVCSSRRADQPCEQATQFAEQAKRWGSRVQVQSVDLSHRQINQQLGDESGYSQAVVQWIDQQLAP